MLKNKNEFPKISIKMKNCKAFYRSKQQAALKKLFSLSPSPPLSHQIKCYCVFGTKIFLRRYPELYIHLLSQCFKNAVLGHQGMVV